jgi:predicted Fe-S protein YdhL (DUF1289 family)
MSEVKSAVNAPELIAALARQVRAGGDKVPSPCISVCRMTESTGSCEGCFRTIDEIRLWSQSDDAAKRAMWELIEQRAAQSTT